MAVLEGGVSTSVAGVGAESGSPLHTLAKPLTVGSLGHYATSHRTVLVASQGAGTRLFSLRNTHSTNLLVLHSVRVQWIQTAAHTASILDSVDLYKGTSFTTDDSGNTETPGITKLRTSFGTSNAAVRGLTVTGNSSGMTGASLTKDSRALRQWSQWLQATLPTADQLIGIDSAWQPSITSGECPLILVQNEGIIIENRAALGAAAGSALMIDVQWAEVTAY